MIDKELERKIEHLNEFIKIWVDFNDFLNKYGKKETISKEDEEAFLNLKSLIARRYQNLEDTLGDDLTKDNNIIPTVTHATTLKQLLGNSGLQMRKIMNDWHSSFILLNKVLGRLESRRETLASINKFSVLFPKIIKNPLLILFLIVCGIIIIYLIISKFGILELPVK